MSEKLDFQRILKELESRQQHSLESVAMRHQSALQEQAEWLANRRSQARAENFSQGQTFRLAGERYALELINLAEVLPLPTITRLPGSSPEVLGVFHLRGRIHPVIDLARLLGLPCQEHGVLLLLRRPEVALRVDEVEQIIDLDPAGASLGHSPYLKAYLSGDVRWLNFSALLEHPIFAPALGPSNKKEGAW